MEGRQGFEAGFAASLTMVSVPRRMHMRDMTHAYAWHDSCIRVIWLLHECDNTHSYAWRDSFICVTWLLEMRDKTHPWIYMTHSYTRHMIYPYGWHHSFICMTWLIHTHDVTYSRVLYDCQLHHFPPYFLSIYLHVLYIFFLPPPSPSIPSPFCHAHGWAVHVTFLIWHVRMSDVMQIHFDTWEFCYT